MDLTDPAISEYWAKEALAFLHEMLGTEWLIREMDERRRGGYLMMDGPDEEDDPRDAPLRENRLLDLATQLEQARRVRGFHHLLAELRKRKVYEAVAELRAANHMMRAGQGVWFHNPNATAGPSYDATVILSGMPVAVEVKAKLEKPVSDYSPKLIQNSLRKARGQLPATGPSMIYLQLSSPWTDDPDVVQSIEATVDHWLTNTGRVNAVILMVERRFWRVGGMSTTRGTATIPNLNPHHPVPDIQGWFSND